MIRRTNHDSVLQTKYFGCRALLERQQHRDARLCGGGQTSPLCEVPLRSRMAFLLAQGILLNKYVNIEMRSTPSAKSQTGIRGTSASLVEGSKTY